MVRSRDLGKASTTGNHMEYFLERIARHLYQYYGDNLKDQCLVFPNRRAGLYILKYLGAEIRKPVWSPTVFTINELFRHYSGLQIADNEILLFELYKVYRRLKKSHESFDDFYYWGEMLINDFDDIDKYLVNAVLLFRNVSDIKSIDLQFGTLDQEQVEIIKRFWINFNPEKQTREKSEFLAVWSVLNDIYKEFRDILRGKNLAYEGMVFRDLAEGLSETAFDLEWDLVHFIGFNALNNCEKKLMKKLKSEEKALFYWDFDNSYIKGSRYTSAGFFLRKNLQTLGNDMPQDWSYNTLLSPGSAPISRRVIDTSSDVAQVKLMSQLIIEFQDITPENAHHTAIILADEDLLLPALTSLPENAGNINITMGHPLKQTHIYSLIRSLLLLQKNARTENGRVHFNYNDVLSILKYLSVSGLLNETENEKLNEIIKINLVWVPEDYFDNTNTHSGRIFRKAATPEILSEYLKNILTGISLNSRARQPESAETNVQRSVDNEFMYRILLSINKLNTIIKSEDINFTIDTYSRILDKILRSQSVPFSGEPLAGIQIMGILETRALDFKNLIILSVNEGILPAVSAGSSFIPFSLRESFGLPDINHQESVYAYHFYRLLHRSENVTFIFNSNTEGLRTGEMSRYLLQLKFDTVMRPDFLSLGFDIRTHSSIRETVQRTDRHSKLMRSFYAGSENEKLLSPTAINTWLHCRMKFYYRYVNRLKEPDRIVPDIDPAMLGSMLHEIMNELYCNYIGQALSGNTIGSFMKDESRLETLMDKTVRNRFGNRKLSIVTGNEIIVKDVLAVYLHRVLEADHLSSPFTVLYLEEPFSFTLNTGSNNNAFNIRVGGNIDRVDITGGITRIVDYKTGKVADRISSVEDLLTDDRQKNLDGWLQILLYCEAYAKGSPQSIITPSIYKVRESVPSELSDKLKLRRPGRDILVVEDYNMVREEFISGLTRTIQIIFSDDESFTMTRDRGKCSYCPYKTLCMR